ncbi:heparinase II/III domain-containing protein [Dyadobacter sandarakinus]|uniref:Heparinase II/III family protein n=1 Tax=Dyadobacter sandarakinus TaxID=2747268 RepID=A0ABX7I6R8_9BACT|nr:heparinase II/III family protein [Dyadobacter sandarakinus]QRR01801.1 heparinase II/III family protein [Dyadobacter sandarakinus]
MKIRLLRLVLLLTAGYLPALAQLTPRNILLSKYDLEAVEASLKGPGEWHPYPQTRQEWEKQGDPASLDSIVAAGEAAMQQPVPAVSAALLLDFVRSGDRTRHAGASFGRRNNLMNLVLAESVEGKGRFMDAIVDYVWAICEETYWGVPAHLSVQKAKNGLPDTEDPTVDLFGAETAAVLALTDYFLGEKLDQVSPLLRRRMYVETNNKIFNALEKPDRYSWLSKKNQVNNWNPWIVSNLVTTALLLEKDAKKRAGYVYQYMGFLDLYLNSLGEDGGCDEGPSYWFAAGASAYDVLELLESATSGKVNVYDHALIRNMAAYVYKVHIAGDYFVNFADADPKLKPDGLMLYRFGKAVDDPALQRFGGWAYRQFGAMVGGTGFHRPRRINNLLSVKTLQTANLPDFTPVRDAWLPDIEVMTARAGNGLYLASHAGHNAESHNHNDVGDFIVYADGEPVIIDAGRGNYTARTFSSQRYNLWFTQSQYHNLPIVNGNGQPAGKNARAKDVKYNLSGNRSTLAMDLTPAFVPEAGVVSWKRQVTLDRAKGHVEVDEDYALKQQPDSLQQVFMTVCEADIREPGKIVLTTSGKKRVQVTYDAKRWSAATDFPSTEGMEYSSFKTKWDGRPVQRIILRSKTRPAKGKHRFVISKL